MLPRDACDGGKRGSCPLCPLLLGARGQELPFPSLLSCEWAFSGIIAGLVQENISGEKPPDPYLDSVQL